MVHDGQQAVAVRRQVDAYYLWTLVGHDIKETRILMGETVVVLPPNQRREQNVERGYLDAPFHLQALLEPFAVLHKVSGHHLRATWGIDMELTWLTMESITWMKGS